MTTPTTAEVGRGSKEPTIVEIDGFRGRVHSVWRRSKALLPVQVLTG
jgi:hypothetical protein